MPGDSGNRTMFLGHDGRIALHPGAGRKGEGVVCHRLQHDLRHGLSAPGAVHAAPGEAGLLTLGGAAFSNGELIMTYAPPIVFTWTDTVGNLTVPGNGSYDIEISTDETFLNATNQWINADPCFRTPHRLPRQGDILTAKTAITLLNHVLRYQFAVTVKRQGREQKRVRGAKPDHVYALAQLNIFQEYHDGVARTKPVLIPWRKDCATVQDEEILRTKSKYGKNIVAPGVAFPSAKRQKFDDQEHGYRPMLQRDVVGNQI